MGTVFFWLIVWAIIGAVVTPFVYQAKGRSLAEGAIFGAIAGGLGALFLLIPLWILTPRKGGASAAAKRKNEELENDEGFDSPLVKQILHYSEKQADAFVLEDGVQGKAIMRLTEFQLAYLKEWTVESVDSTESWFIHQSYMEMMNRDIYAVHSVLDALKEERYEVEDQLGKAKLGELAISETDYMQLKPGAQDSLMGEFFFHQNPRARLKSGNPEGDFDRLTVLSARKERLDDDIKSLEWGVQQIETLMNKLLPEFEGDEAFEVRYEAIQ